jgi:predicted GNAT superfamily acetyltransferase
LRAALAGMAGAGGRAVVVEADPQDAAAMSFHARLGFAPKGTALLLRALPTARPPLVGGR